MFVNYGELRKEVAEQRSAQLAARKAAAEESDLRYAVAIAMAMASASAMVDAAMKPFFSTTKPAGEAGNWWFGLDTKEAGGAVWFYYIPYDYAECAYQNDGYVQHRLHSTNAEGIVIEVLRILSRAAKTTI